MNVRVQNLNKRYKLNETAVKRIIRKVLKHIKAHEDTELEFVFLDDRSIKKLNKRYKKRDRPTDVLSFDLDTVGEVFISLDRARENSKAFGTSLEREIVLYMIHGILHLFGYEDGTRKDKARMSGKEKCLLSHLSTSTDLSKVLMPR